MALFFALPGISIVYSRNVAHSSDESDVWLSQSVSLSGLRSFRKRAALQLQVLSAHPSPLCSSATMAPHLTLAEQDVALSALAGGKTPIEIHSILAKRRAAKKIEMMNLTAVRRFLRGKTHKRGKVETRGRKRALTRRNVLAMDKARLKFIASTKGTRQATWNLISDKGRAPKTHRTTVARSFTREGVDVKLRRCREKPQRTAAMEKERGALCGKMRRWPLTRFTDEIDLILDNKKFEVPTTPEARAYQAKQKLVSQLRKRDEGLATNFTKPKEKAHRRNLGGSVNVCAGISNCRIALWEYYTKWNGEAAADMYRGPIMKTLKRTRGEKASYLLAEDNDPSGYKSSKAVAEKRRLHIKTIDWPRYSPDLMPLDFSLWAHIAKRVRESAPRGRESVADFKLRLRREALRTPSSVVRSAVEAMRMRARKIAEAKGKDIDRD